MRTRIHEPAVTLSDLALAAETGVFAWRHWRRDPTAITDGRARSLRRGFIGYFASSAAAALAGAAVHGLSASKDDPARLVWWRASLCSIGLTGWSAWHLAAAAASADGATRTVPVPIHALHLAYLAVVVRTRPPFRLALAVYAPAALALRLALISLLRVPGERGAVSLALIGLTVSTAAGVIQLRRIAIDPRLFDHNATFHALQAVAFAIFHVAASRMTGAAQAGQ